MPEQASVFMETVKQWVAENGLNFVSHLVLFIIVLIVGWLVIRTVLSIMRQGLRRASRVSEILENFTINIAHKVLWIILIMMALPIFGVNVGPLIAGLGVGGFIIGFAFQETLGNLAAGLMLLLNQPYQKGHYVEAAGTAGKVEDMNIMATVLLTPDNKKVTVPNSSVWGSSITNYSVMPTRRVDMTIGISYKADIAKAIEVTEKLLKQDERVLDDPAPTIAVVELADSSVNLVVRPWVATADYWDIYFGVTRGLKEAFDNEDIEIPFPQLDLHVQELPKP